MINSGLDLRAPFRTGEFRSQVGVEIELSALDSSTGRVLPLDGEKGIRNLLEHTAELLDGEVLTVDGECSGVKLPSGASFALEPGGAIEYCSVPVESVLELRRDAHSAIQRLQEVAASRGAGLHALGLMPYEGARRNWLSRPRYESMQEYFGTHGDPLAARRIMCHAQSLQVALDYHSLADLCDKVELMTRSAPIFAALLANSPIEAGRWTGMLSRRQTHYESFDPPRALPAAWCLAPGRTLDHFLAWALSIPFFMRTCSGNSVRLSPRPFGEFLKFGYDDGSFPTMSDWELHLSFLYCAVRVRGFLELRYMDAVPEKYCFAAVALIVGLGYSEQARREAMKLLTPASHADVLAACRDGSRLGLSARYFGRSLTSLASELLEIAAMGLSARIEQGVEHAAVLGLLDPLLELCEAGKTVAEVTGLAHACRCEEKSQVLRSTGFFS